MAQFARGDLLGRVVVAGDQVPVLLYKATLDTELSLVWCAATNGDLNLRFFHDNVDPATYDVTTALVWDYPVTQFIQGVLWASQTLGNGIHVRPGGSVAVASDVACTVSLYGTTVGLLEVRD